MSGAGTKVAKVQLVESPAERGDKLRPPSWIEIELVDEEGVPITEECCRIELPDGQIEERKLDNRGRVRLVNIPAGICRVSFPDSGAAVGA